MAEAQDSLKVSIKGDLQELQDAVKQGDRELAAFKLKAEANARVRLQVDIAKYQSDLADARRKLTEFRKAADAEGEIKTRIDIEGLQAKIRDGKSALRDLQGEVANTGRSFFSLNTLVLDAIKAFGALQLVRKVAGFFREAFDASIAFESAFAGVVKTVEGTPEQLAAISDEFREMAKTVPLPIEGLVRIGELAGQLGVATEDVTKFSETIAKLGVTTNLTEEEAATSFARIANIFKQPASEVERLGSSVVALGNNFATTEQEIVNFANQIAGTSAAVGLNTQDIVALGAAFTSVGVEAEAGGTAVQKTLLALNQAVVNGGEELDKFAQISGTTAQDFAALWKSSPIKAFDLFVKGLGNSGDQAANVLDELVAGDVRLTRAFLSLAQSGDLLTRSIDTSNTAFEQNNALNKEASTRFETNESKLQALKNRWNDLAITIGDFLVKVAVPVFTFFTELAETLVTGAGKFAALASAIKAAGIGLATYFSVSVIAGLAKALTSISISLALVASRAGLASVSVGGLGAASTVTARALGLAATSATFLSAALGPISLVATAIAFAFIGAKQRADNFRFAMNNLSETLLSFADQNTGITDIAKEIESLTKQTVAAQKEIFALQNRGLFGEELDELLAEQTEDVLALRGAYESYLESLGATPAQIQAIKDELGFFNEIIAPTKKELEAIADSTTEVGKVFADVGKNFNDTATKFRENVNAMVQEGVALEVAIGVTKKNIKKDFVGIAADADDLADSMIESLIKASAETEGIGAAFTKGYASGLERQDVLKALKDAGFVITDEVLGQLLAASVAAGDRGEVTALLFAAGVDREAAAGAMSAQNLSDFVTQTLGSVQNQQNAKIAGQSLGGQSVGGVVAGIKKAFPQLTAAFGGILGALNAAASVGDVKFTGVAAIDSALNGLVGFGNDFKAKAQAVSDAFASASQQVNNAVDGFDKPTGGGGGANSALKEAEKKAKDAEKAVEDFNKQIEETGKRSARLKEQVKEFYGEIVDDIDKAREAQGLLNDELESFKAEETTTFVKDTARRDVELAEEEKDLRAEIKDLEDQQTDSAEEAAKVAEEKIELEQKLNDVLEERRQIQEFIAANPDQATTFTAETELAGQSQFEQDKAAFDERIAQKEAEINAEIEKQQRIIDIRERFLELQTSQEEQAIKDRERLNAIASGEENLTAEERKAALLELGFGELSVQEQIDLLKQAQQASALEVEKEAILKSEEDILAAKEEFFRLAQEAHAGSVDAMVLKTQELIDVIKSAQIEQQKLNALQRSSGGASGSTTNVNVTNNNSSNVDAEAATASLLNKVNQ